MIYTFFEQLTIALKFIILGAFLSIMVDLISIFNYKSKIFGIIVQIIFWFLMAYIICHAVLVISKGYLPIYTFLFFLLGYFLYFKYLRKKFIEILKKIKIIIKQNNKNIIMFFYPREVMAGLKKIVNFLYNKIKKMVKLIKEKIILLFKGKIKIRRKKL